MTDTINKIDLVIQTNKGSKTCFCFLKGIEEVIPKDFVDDRILVDDHCVDNNREMRARIVRKLGGFPLYPYPLVWITLSSTRFLGRYKWKVIFC